MRVALLTGGGDSPATNAAIRAVVRKAHATGFEVIGVKRGWRGLIQNDLVKLDLRAVSGILHRGGTILGTSRTNPFRIEGGVESILGTIDDQGIDAVIAIGGDDTNGVAHKLGAHQVRCVGIPQTIDNDLSGTDYSIGFDTAVSIACDALDKLHTTASSHHRVMILEVMGRDAGWIALIAGIAGGADVILVPEVPVDLDDIVRCLEKRRRMEKDFSIIVVSEGARPPGCEDQIVQDRTPDDFGHVRLGGIGRWLAEQLEDSTGLETRVTHLGYLQRGGVPTVFDRVLATRLGVFSVDMVRDGTFGHMACIRDNELVALPYSEVLGRNKPVSMDLYELTGIFC